MMYWLPQGPLEKHYIGPDPVSGYDEWACCSADCMEHNSLSARTFPQEVLRSMCPPLANILASHKGLDYEGAKVLGGFNSQGGRLNSEKGGENS